MWQAFLALLSQMVIYDFHCEHHYRHIVIPFDEVVAWHSLTSIWKSWRWLRFRVFIFNSSLIWHKDRWEIVLVVHGTILRTPSMMKSMFEIINDTCFNCWDGLIRECFLISWLCLSFYFLKRFRLVSIILLEERIVA